MMDPPEPSVTSDSAAGDTSKLAYVDESTLSSDELAALEAERRRRKALLYRVARSLRSQYVEKNEAWDRIIETKVLHITLFSLAGLLVSAFQSNYKWSQRCVENAAGLCGAPDVPAGGSVRNSATWANTREFLPSVWLVLLICQGLMSVTTVVTLLLLVQYYGLLVHEKRREWSGKTDFDLLRSSNDAVETTELFNKSYSLWNSQLKWWLLLELLVHVIHPIMVFETYSPAFQTIFEVSEVLIFLRLYALARLLFLRTNMYFLRVEIINENEDLRRKGYCVTPSAVFKQFFYAHPAAMMGIILTTILVVYGLWMFVIERNNNESFDTMWESTWFVWETVTTIGYGDLFATSTTGRIVVLLMTLTSLLVTTIFAGVVTNLLSLSHEERDVQQILQQRGASESHLHSSAQLLLQAVRERQHQAEERLKGGHATIARWSGNMYRTIKAFRESRQMVRESASSGADPLMDVYMRQSIVGLYSLASSLDQQDVALRRMEAHVAKALDTIQRSLATSEREKTSAAAR